MTKPIKEYTNEDLNRLCAEVQGWESKHPVEQVVPCSPLDTNWWFKDNTFFMPVFRYTPTTNKTQALDLLEAFPISVFGEPLNSPYYGKKYHCQLEVNKPDYKFITSEAPTPSLAIAKAVAAMQLEKEND